MSWAPTGTLTSADMKALFAPPPGTVKVADLKVGLKHRQIQLQPEPANERVGSDANDRRVC